MKQNIELYKLITGWHQISLWQFVMIENLFKQETNLGKDNTILLIVYYLTGIGYDTLLSLPIEDKQKVLSHYNFLSRLTNHEVENELIEVNGKRFKRIVDPSTFSDQEVFRIVSEWTNPYNIVVFMAQCYQPLKKTLFNGYVPVKNGYTPEAIKSRVEFFEKYLDMPVVSSIIVPMENRVLKLSGQLLNNNTILALLDNAAKTEFKRLRAMINEREADDAVRDQIAQIKGVKLQ